MKKSTIFLIITIPTIIILGLGYLGFDFFMNQIKINLTPFTKDTAITINQKILELPDKYPNSKTTKDVVLDTVNIQFFDDIKKNLKEASISDQSSFATYENTSGNALGKVSKNTDGSFTILFICTNYYKKID